MVTDDTEKNQWMIFLCYSPEDWSCIEWLYQRLLNMNIKIWSMQQQVLIGESELLQVGEGLRESLFLLIVISKHALTDGMVKAQLEQMQLRQIDQQKTTVLPITLDGTKPEKV